MDQIGQLRSLIKKHELTGAADRILKSAKPSMQLIGNNSAKVTRSRLGGDPDLTSVEAWPTRSREALSFIGQIALDELPLAPMLGGLPKSGLLSFFYDAEGQPWGMGTNERSSWRVLYSDETRPLVRVTTPPRPVPVSLSELSIRFQPAISIPTFRSIELDRLELTDQERNSYFDLRAAYFDLTWGNNPAHQLFGHPDGVQGCMQRTVQFASRDEELPEGVHNYYEHPRAAELIPGAFDWKMLLQVDSDERLGPMWGDAGRIYFWIHRDDLAAKQFDRSWLFLQCG